MYNIVVVLANGGKKKSKKQNVKEEWEEKEKVKANRSLISSYLGYCISCVLSTADEWEKNAMYLKSVDNNAKHKKFNFLTKRISCCE